MRDLQESLRETHSVGPRTREWIVSARVCPAMRKRDIPLLGISDAAEGFLFVRKRWDHCQVMACFAGQGEVMINGRWHACGAGMAYLTPPGVEHAYRAAKGSRWGLCWVHHHGALVSSAAPILAEADPKPLRSAIRGLYRESIGACEPDAMNLWLETIHLYASRMATCLPQGDALAKVWTQVSSDLARAWTLTELSERALMSGEHLRRICLKQFGRSPMQHVTHLRMKHASMLLAFTDRKIDTVARSVGYRNAFAFSTAFKRHVGQSPAFYRQSQEKRAVTPAWARSH
jgi:AraC-like DNA-binding protein